VAYFVEFADPVRDYLAGIEGLLDADRATIIDEVIEELSRDAGRFLALYPLAHESFCFRYDYARVTRQAVFGFDFVVSAHQLAMGVVQVVYVEHTIQPLP
jgi:hypothetical protein